LRGEVHHSSNYPVPNEDNGKTLAAVGRLCPEPGRRCIMPRSKKGEMRAMKLAKVALLRKPLGEFEIEEHPLPQPGPGEMLLKVELAGICGTDVHIYEGYGDPRLFPVVLGHENVGLIEALGEEVKADFFGERLRVGDRVAVQPGVACYSCYYCLVLKSPTRCVNKRGSYGFGGSRKTPFTGGFSQYLLVDMPGTFLAKTEMPAERAVLLEPLTVALHAADRSNIRLGDTVVIQGSGAIGLMTLICARMAGANRVIVIGGPEGRLKLARRLGADLTIDIEAIPDRAERARLVRENTRGGYGADVVLECAGVGAALVEAFELVRDSGTVVEVGHFIDTGTITLNPNRHLVVKNLNLIGVFGSALEHFARGLPILEKGEHPFAEMLSHQLPLEEVRNGMEALRGSYRLGGREVIKIAIKPN